VFAEVKTLVGAVNDDGVFCQFFVVEILEHSTDVFIDGIDTAKIVFDVPLILPANEVFTFGWVR